MSFCHPIYLHFLDRELWESVGAHPDKNAIARALRTLLIGCNETLYCGVSLIWENPALRTHPTSIDRFILKLIEFNAIEIISQYPTTQEFVESRRELYKHDRDRYPLYFAKMTSDVGPRATSVKTSSATIDLANQLHSWTIGGTERLFDSREAPQALRKAVRTAITNRENEAITFAFFRPHIKSVGSRAAEAEYMVRRQISRGYTTHYMTHACGDLATGISSLSYFDALSKTFPEHDIDLLEYLLRLCGMERIITEPFENHEIEWAQIASIRHSSASFHDACANIKTILRTFYYQATTDGSRYSNKEHDLFGIRAAIKMTMKEHLKGESSKMENTSIDYSSLLLLRTTALLNSIKIDKDLIKAYTMAKSEIQTKTPRLLIATATKVERDTVLRMAKQLIGAEHVPEFGPRRSYYRLGRLGGVDLFLTQSEMGSTAPGSSLSTIGDAIDDLKPLGVVMVGIAFGMKEKDQNIGEIIVARDIQNYEIARIGTDKEGNRTFIPRGYRVHSSPTMLSRLRLAEAGWTGKKVIFGLLLTGEKLLDNFDYREELRTAFPEADGGEMEGGGLYAAAMERKTDWIIVKAICDWADGNKRKNKERRQASAAAEAVGFLLRAVQQGGFQFSAKNLEESL